jgi:hypothetical protein
MIPEVWDVYSSRNVFEFENFDLENVRTDFSWKAYGGEMVVVGYQGRLRKRAYFKKGLYNVDVVFTDGSRETDFEIKIGEFKTNVTIGSESANYQLFQSKLRLAENLDLDGDTDISFELVTDTVGLIALDSLIVVPVGHEYHERSPGAMFVTNRYEDVARLLNLWVTYNKDGKYLFLFLIRCYPVWMLLNILFLSFCTWTPGALIFRLRIITLKGERPGFNGAVMRVFAAFAGLFAFGYGGFQPLISHDERTWSDTWSRTRLVILE